MTGPRELPDGCPTCGALPCDWANDPAAPSTANEGEAVCPNSSGCAYCDEHGCPRATPDAVTALRETVLDRVFANTPPIDWSDAEWAQLSAALTKGTEHG